MKTRVSFALALIASSLVACTQQVGDEGPVDTTSSALNGDQVYAVANVYNSGVGDGFVRSFTSIGDWTSANTSFNQQYSLWPGGPIAGGTHGASITYDGLPLPSFWSTGVASPTSYQVAVNNSNALDAILISRTPYSAYFSLGSLIASAEAQAQFSNAAVGLTARQNAWNLSISLLQSATSLANDLCRPSTYVWKTAFNVQEMRDLLNSAPPGPNYINWAAWGYTTNPAAYLRDRLTGIRGHLGSIVANVSTLESGVHGQGCIK